MLWVLIRRAMSSLPAPHMHFHWICLQQPLPAPLRPPLRIWFGNLLYHFCFQLQVECMTLFTPRCLRCYRHSGGLDWASMSGLNWASMSAADYSGSFSWLTSLCSPLWLSKYPCKSHVFRRLKCFSFRLWWTDLFSSHIVRMCSTGCHRSSCCNLHWLTTVQ